MRWPRFHRRHQTSAVADSLDIADVLAAGLKDRDTARRSIARLRHERDRLEREKRVLERQCRRRTPRELLNVGRAGMEASEMGAFQMFQATADAGASESLRGEQLVTIDARLEAINDALVLLNTYVRESH